VAAILKIQYGHPIWPPENVIENFFGQNSIT